MTWEMGGKADLYYEMHKDRLPSKFIVNAAALVQQRPATAVELGAGQMTETRFLVRQGFNTQAVDVNPGVIKYADDLLKDPKFSLTVCDFKNLNLPDASVNLITSQFALQFLPKEKVGDLTTKIKGWLTPGGLFVANVLGNGDLWNKPNNKDMSFFEKKELLHFLEERGLDVFYLTEHYSNEADCSKNPKTWWHYFNFIAQNPTKV